MKFETGYTQRVNGTCLQGHIRADYSRLVELFGEPTSDGDGYKTDAEWTLEFEDGTVATIYNWKNGQNYCGEHGLIVERITEWNVGGHDSSSYLYVLGTLFDRDLTDYEKSV